MQRLANKDFKDNGDLINKKGKSIVLFYSESCGYCIEFKPTFEEFALTIKNKNIGTAYGVHMPDDPVLSNRVYNIFSYKFTGVPTVVAFKDGKSYSVYSGDRTLKDLIKFISTY